MRVVVDANVLAAALVRPDGWTAQELAREDVRFLAPALLVDELARHEVDLAAKAGLAVRTFRARARRTLRSIEVVPTDRRRAAATDPLVDRASAVNPADALYLAAYVAADADLLWTRDRALLAEFPGIAVAVVPRSHA